MSSCGAHEATSHVAVPEISCPFSCRRSRSKGRRETWTHGKATSLCWPLAMHSKQVGPRNHMFTSVMQLHELLCPRCVSRGFRSLLTLESYGVQLIASCAMLEHPVCRELLALLYALHFAAACAFVPQLHTSNNYRHRHLSKHLAYMGYTCWIQLDLLLRQGICLHHVASLTPHLCSLRRWRHEDVS